MGTRAATPVVRLLLALALVGAVALLGPLPAAAQTPVTLFQSFAGDLDFTGTGATLRAQPNTGNACALNPSGANPLAGIPATSTVRAAYLYWAGSGSTVDSTVTFQTPVTTATINASRTFTETFPLGGTNYDFFSGFADVTALVEAARNGTYTLSNLTVNSGAPHCAVSAVLSGWSLLVIYEDAAEPLRVINVFDGFRFFRGGQITLTPDNFVVPTAPIDGRLGHITWEGDVENSASLNGFSERLAFDGNTLTDALNPVNNQFNSTVNLIPDTTTYGVDFDVYDISPFLSPGQTSGVSLYSSGQDLVLLSAEVFSTTNTPVADLALTKTHVGNFQEGVLGTYTLGVSNAGPSSEPGPITVTDTLPAGLSYDSFSGTGWSCGAVGQTVTCTHAGPLAAGASLPPLSLVVLPDATAVPGVTNTATVAGTAFDNILADNTASDPTVVLAANSDLSTSTKGVVDLNGGLSDPGDVLRYTITINETLGGVQAGVQVTDDIPANVTGFTVVAIPPGATDASTGAGTGANGTGFLDVQNITVPANGSVTIVFDVTIAAGTPAGTVISNTANVINPQGWSAMPSAPDVIVSAPPPASGVKALYLYGSPGLALSRIPPTGLPPVAAVGNVIVDKGAPVTWALAQPLAAPLTLGPGAFPVDLWLRRGNTNPAAVSRTLQIDVFSASLGLIGTVTQGVLVTGVPQLFTFPVAPAIALPTTLPAGDVISLRITNVTPGGGSRRIRVFPVVLPNGNSKVDLNATTVINVDSVTSFDAAFPGGVPTTNFVPGSTVFARAVVSDPFGDFDIAGATIDIIDPFGVPVVTAAPMTQVATGGALRTYEFPFPVPPGGPAGTWTMRVTATEGLEGTITHVGIGTFDVVMPDLVVFKTALTTEDPFNGTTDPISVPGAKVMYTVGVTNQGGGAADNDTVVVDDALPAEVELFVNGFGGPSPILFVDGATASGLSLVFGGLGDLTDDIEFDDGGGTFTYVPTPDADGFDALVRAVRVNPTGTLAASSGAPHPSFELRFQVRVR